MKKAHPVLLGAYHARWKSLLPDEFLGDVLGNLNARRGRIEGMEVEAVQPR
jgi:elongation factor G